MNEDEKGLFKEIIDMRQEFNTRVNRLMISVAVLFGVLVIVFGATASIMTVSYNRAIEQIQERHDRMITDCTRLYFETDYDYGTITQSVEVGENND